MRVPDAAQRELRRSGAPLIRDLREGGVWNDPGSERIIPLRFMLRSARDTPLTQRLWK
jgi:hypothetical protein